MTEQAQQENEVPSVEARSVAQMCRLILIGLSVPVLIAVLSAVALGTITLGQAVLGLGIVPLIYGCIDAPFEKLSWRTTFLAAFGPFVVLGGMKAWDYWGSAPLGPRFEAAVATSLVYTLGLAGNFHNLPAIGNWLQRFLQRFWYGSWMYHPETKQWHRVAYDDGKGDILYDVSTWDVRHRAELLHRHFRRQGLRTSAILGVSGSLLLIYLLGNDFHVHAGGNGPLEVFLTIGAWFFVGSSALVVLALLPFGLLGELFYRLGFQRMEGAKVLDPQPQRTDLADVHQQQAHGTARLATEEEAEAAARGDKPTEKKEDKVSLEDQEFAD